MPATAIDHILYATSDLERGMDEIEGIVGVRPIIGGRHPNFGTHNALLSLGPDVYLEVIARDPELPVPNHGLLVDLPPDAESRLITWVLRVANIDAAAAAADDAGLDVGDVQAGRRETPDGDVVRWQLTDPYAGRLQGALPFLINWGDTPHPAGVAPVGGRLTGLMIEHPDADAVRSALNLLGANVGVGRASTVGLKATIDTAAGMRTLS